MKFGKSEDNYKNVNGTFVTWKQINIDAVGPPGYFQIYQGEVDNNS